MLPLSCLPNDKVVLCVCVCVPFASTGSHFLHTICTHHHCIIEAAEITLKCSLFVLPNMFAEELNLLPEPTVSTSRGKCRKEHYFDKPIKDLRRGKGPHTGEKTQYRVFSPLKVVEDEALSLCQGGSDRAD